MLDLKNGVCPVLRRLFSQPSGKKLSFTTALQGLLVGGAVMVRVGEAFIVANKTSLPAFAYSSAVSLPDTPFVLSFHHKAEDSPN